MAESRVSPKGCAQEARNNRPCTHSSAPTPWVILGRIGHESAMASAAANSSMSDVAVTKRDSKPFWMAR